MKGSRSIIGTAIALGLLAGSTVGVSAHEEAATAPIEPVAFTARFAPGPVVRAASHDLAGGQADGTGRVEQTGPAWAPTIIEVSDPRLDGEMTQRYDEAHYPGAEGPESFVIGSSTYRIVNEEGAWQGTSTYFQAGSGYGGRDAAHFGTLVVLVGEGAYDGLYAVADVSDWRAVSGFIFPAPPPPVPVAP